MEKQTILIVDDNEDLLSFLKKDLGKNYEILTAFHGEEAIEIIKENIVHLVISDIMMPVMDGNEFCERIKTDIHSSHIPVILLTAQNTLQAKIEGLTNGADAYIEKPFSIEHLDAQVYSLLQNRRRIKEHFTSFPLTQFKSIAVTKTDELFLETLQQLIEDQMAEYDLDIDFLAKGMNMSRPALYRKIKSISDLSPYEMVNLTRLKKAAELINTDKYSLSEISAIVGYASLAHFSRNFKKQFRINPSEYLKK